MSGSCRRADRRRAGPPSLLFYRPARRSRNSDTRNSHAGHDRHERVFLHSLARELLSREAPDGEDARATTRSKLGAVEINNTFYRMPRPTLLERWAAETPPTFRFALKSPRSITHMKKLVDVGDAVARLDEAARALGDRLGPILFQLPAVLRKDLRRARGVPGDVRRRAAGCARRSSSATSPGSADDVYARCARHDAALCIADRRTCDAARGDRRLGLPAPAAAGLRRGGAAPAGPTA